MRPSRRTAALCSLALAVQLLALAAGLRFDVQGLDGNFYLLDPAWLRGDLFRSLFALHAQPPLFNLVVALALRLSPAHWPLLLHGAWFLCAFATITGCERLARQLGASPRLSFAAAALLCISPAFLLYQHALMTEVPCAALLVWSLIWSSESPRTPRTAGLSLLACVAACLCKPFFAPPFALVFALRLAWAQPRRVVLFAFAPLALLTALVLKNALCFDSPSTSSWAGMNLARTSVSRAPLPERTRLIADGVLSPASAVEPFSPISTYRALVPGLCPSPTGIPALDEERKAGGALNLNQACYPRVAKLLLRDHLALLARHPSLVANSALDATLQFLRPASDYHWLQLNRVHLAMWDYIWTLLSLPIPLPFLISGHAEIFILPLILYVLALTTALRRWRDPAAFLCAFTLSWIALVGILGDVGENNRFRFESAPLVAALLVGAGRRDPAQRPCSDSPRRWREP